MNKKAKILKQYDVYLDFQEFKKKCDLIIHGEIEENAQYQKSKKILEKFDDYLHFMKYQTDRFMFIRSFIDESTKDGTGRNILNSCHGSFDGQYYFVMAETCENRTLSISIPLDLFLIGEEEELKSYIRCNMISRMND